MLIGGNISKRYGVFLFCPNSANLPIMVRAQLTHVIQDAISEKFGDVAMPMFSVSVPENSSRI
ncbi:MAG: hypothetical protein G01um101433_436 [Parcubacteria group bacterium Gr01-1014_33]|nr:MAG: hypothetical protein G01um101433_436 [Parcubacteria group bacterium Gr01-1014_33]